MMLLLFRKYSDSSIEGVLIAAVTVPEPPRSVLAEVDLEGELNGYSLDGSALAWYDAPTNVNGGVIDWQDVPELGNAMMAASKYSILSINFCIYSRSINGAVNLFSVIGLPHHAEVDYTLVHPDGSVIGQYQQSSHFEMAKPWHPGETMMKRGKSTVTGHFEGDLPKRIETSPGYSIFLSQSDRGLVHGIYGQTMFCENGEYFYELVRRRYMFDNDNSLPFDEIWNFKFLRDHWEVKDDRRIMEYRATSYYTPAEAQHGHIDEFDRAFSDALQEEGISIPQREVAVPVFGT
ncbi:MAG: hypothetical protein OXE05_11290 [Chloroflexi bacterium]|nr:hypothetical protein [Chloroflexota bacterium]